MDDAQLLRYSRHILLPELGIDAQESFAAAHALDHRRRRARRAGRAVPRRRRCRHAHALRSRPRRPHQPATADPVRDRRCRRAQGRRRAARRLAAINPEVRIETVERARRARRARAARRRAPTSSSTAATTSRRATRSTARASPRKSRSSRARRSASTDRSPCSTRAIRERPATTACSAKAKRLEETRCAIMGVFAPLVGIVGATQAAEALKLLAGVGETIAGPSAAARRARDALARSCASRAIPIARCAEEEHDASLTFPIAWPHRADR